MPDEARLFFRRGLIAERAGQYQEAVRLIRGAADLDPGFVTPHLTLASWSVLRDPGQTLMHYGVALDIVRRSFLLQIELVANLAFFAMHALFVGLVATGLALVVLRQAELRHLWQERVARLLSPGSARLWAWVLLALPFACGVGLALPAVLLLGLVWPVLRSRERTLYALLVMTLIAIPLASGVLGRLAAPLRVDQAPLYGVAELQDEAWTPERGAELANLATTAPDNPAVQFGLGWTARQGGDLATAETAYRRASSLWPKNDRVLNNLANVLVAEGRLDEAIGLYRRAVAIQPENASAWFNLSQVYTRQFEYHDATEAAAKASAIDFDLVKGQQALGTDDGTMPLADEWLAPRTLWTIVLDGRGAGVAATPAAWRGHVESAGWRFSLLVAIVALASVTMGLRWQKVAPLRPCHNCGRIICRRCAQRRRELALCPACGGEAGRAESAEFSRVLLGRRRLAVERSQRLTRTTLAALIPGFGLLAFHRGFRALAITSGMVLLSAPWLGVHAPFTFQSPTGSGSVLSPILILASWAALYAFSILSYFGVAAGEARRAAALVSPVRSRPTQATTTTARAA
ncbi:MAG: tetratricopeptide repeat protein [Candidatus Eisenbacteria bacterium]|nr:tetratricopeptide repeat protein [Candidatus Eisenbacteria bacterium]